MDGNVFKKKTKVINDEDDELVETLKISSNKHQNSHKTEEKSLNNNPNNSSAQKKSSTSNSHQNGSNKKPLSIEDKIKQIKSESTIKSNGTGSNVQSNLSSAAITNVDRNKINNISQNSNKKKIEINEQGNKHKSVPSKNELLNKKTKRKKSSDRSGGEESEDSSYNSSSSSSSDDSSSGSSASKSEKAESLKKIKVNKPTRVVTKEMTPPPKKKQTETIVIKKQEKASKSSKVMKTKSTLVNQLLRRWWYALPKWPPEDFDASEELAKLKLRLVDKSEWKLEPLLDDRRYTKCVELDGFRHVYVDPVGTVHDLRPKDSIPSFNNFMKKPEKELYRNLIKAYENQIRDLESGEKYSSQVDEVISTIKDELKEAQLNYNRIK